MRRCSFILLWLWCLGALAAEVIPAKPDRYFNDYAHVVDPGVGNALNTQLEDLEKSSSDQVVVAIYPKMQSESSIDDYTIRVARAWGVGQKGKNNGVVLFVFIQDRKMFIQVGYGLEGALPDATCKQITEYEIKPHFKAGDYTGGLKAGVNAIIAAVHGEYKGTGATVNQQRQNSTDPGLVIAIIIFLIFFIVVLSAASSGRQRHGWIIGSGGWGGWSGGGGGWSGGGGGGGFSGGGGSFGGGGAGSSW